MLRGYAGKLRKHTVMISKLACKCSECMLEDLR